MHPKQFRLLILEPAGNLWGSERALLDLLDGLLRQEVDVSLVVPRSSPILDVSEDLVSRIIPVLDTNLHQQGKMRRVFSLIRFVDAVRRIRPNLIYVNQAGATRLALRAAKLFGISVVSHVRLPTDADYLSRLKSDTHLNSLICVSDYVKNAVEAVMDDNTSCTALHDCYCPSNRNTWHTPTKSNLQPVELACVGRIEPNKGQHLLIDAMATLRESRIASTLSFIGEPANTAYLDSLVARIKELELGDSVRFEGFSKNVVERLKSSSFLLCPSYSEALGRVIFEAWDAGIIPIAWAGSGGPAESIELSQGGGLYPQQTGTAIASVITDLLHSDAGYRTALVQNGRRWILDELAPDAYAERMMHIFREAALCKGTNQ